MGRLFNRGHALCRPPVSYSKLIIPRACNATLDCDPACHERASVKKDRYGRTVVALQTESENTVSASWQTGETTRQYRQLVGPFGRVRRIGGPFCHYETYSCRVPGRDYHSQFGVNSHAEDHPSLYYRASADSEIKGIKRVEITLANDVTSCEVVVSDQTYRVTNGQLERVSSAAGSSTEAGSGVTASVPQTDNPQPRAAPQHDIVTERGKEQNDAKAQADLERERLKNSALERQLAEESEELAKAEEKLEELSTQLDAASRNAASNEQQAVESARLDERAAADKRAAEIEVAHSAVVEAAQTKAEQNETAARELQAKLSAQEQQTADLQTKLTEKDQAISGLQEQIAQLKQNQQEEEQTSQGELTDLKTTTRDLTEELRRTRESATADHQAGEKRETELQSQISSLEAQLSQRQRSEEAEREKSATNSTTTPGKLEAAAGPVDQTPLQQSAGFSNAQSQAETLHSETLRLAQDTEEERREQERKEQEREQQEAQEHKEQEREKQESEARISELEKKIEADRRTISNLTEERQFKLNSPAYRSSLTKRTGDEAATESALTALDRFQRAQGELLARQPNETQEQFEKRSEADVEKGVDILSGYFRTGLGAADSFLRLMGKDKRTRYAGFVSETGTLWGRICQLRTKLSREEQALQELRDPSKR